MSKSFDEEPRRGPVGLVVVDQARRVKDVSVPPSGPQDPRQSVSNKRNSPEPYRDLTQHPNLTGTYFEEHGRYRLFINHAGPHLECLLTLVNSAFAYRKRRGRDRRLPARWGLDVGSGQSPKPLAYRFAGQWVGPDYRLYVPVWLGVFSPGTGDADNSPEEVGVLAPGDGDEIEVTFFQSFKSLWPDEPLFAFRPHDFTYPTTALRQDRNPVLLERYLDRAAVEYETRSSYWFPITPQQSAALETQVRLLASRVRVDPSRAFARTGEGGRSMDMASLLLEEEKLEITAADNHARDNIVTAIDEVFLSIYEAAVNGSVSHHNLTMEQLRNELRPLLLRALDHWKLGPEPKARSVGTALTYALDRAHGATTKHIERVVGLRPRGWRTFKYSIEIELYRLIKFDDPKTQDAYDDAKKQAKRVKKALEKSLKDAGDQFRTFKKVAKFLPVTYMGGRATIRYLGVVPSGETDGEVKAPEQGDDEPWVAHYGIGMGGIQMSRTTGDTPKMDLQGTGIVRSGRPPTPEDLVGHIAYHEGNLYSGIDLDEDPDGEWKGELGPSRAQMFFYSDGTAPSIRFAFTGGVGYLEQGASASVKVVNGWSWLISTSGHRVRLTPKVLGEDDSFEAFYRDRIASVAVHFPINGARIPVPTEDESAEMYMKGLLSVPEALQAFTACELPLITHSMASMAFHGYADPPAEREYNFLLSLHRAMSGRNYMWSLLGDQFNWRMSWPDLEDRGRLVLKAHGEPDTPEGRDPNTKEEFDPRLRRVDIDVQLLEAEDDDAPPASAGGDDATLPLYPSTDE
jgi:hypothetical protein